MQIVIDIDEKIYNEYMNLATGRIPIYKACDIAWILKNGTVLPKGHGELIDRDKIEYLKAIHDAKYGHISWIDAIEKIKYSAPTIIEADKEN
jgi:hypothetical protein